MPTAIKSSGVARHTTSSHSARSISAVSAGDGDMRSVAQPKAPSPLDVREFGFDDFRDVGPGYVGHAHDVFVDNRAWPRAVDHRAGGKFGMPRDAYLAHQQQIKWRMQRAG